MSNICNAGEACDHVLRVVGHWQNNPRKLKGHCVNGWLGGCDHLSTQR